MSEEMATILKELKYPNPHARIKALDTIGTRKPSNAIDIITPYLLDRAYQGKSCFCLEFRQDQGYQCYSLYHQSG
jgi:hypothetical protein